MAKQYRDILMGRKLAERSYLYFRYPSKTGDVDFYLPFMENIEITESQKPNLVTYDIVGRAGNLVAYMGSKSRDIKISFYFTLPNIIDYLHNVGLSPLFSDNFRKVADMTSFSQRQLFFKNTQNKDEPTDEFSKFKSAFGYYTHAAADIAAFDPAFAPLDKSSGVLGLFQELSEGIDNFGNKYLPFGDADRGKSQGKFSISTEEAVNYVMKWINVIRSSVVNNSKQTQYGPPTVYINHGTMYNNIPCICNGVSIKLVSEYGYDLISFTPRRIQVTMDLIEHRVGDFGEFQPFDPIKGDNLVGWEAVMNYTKHLGGTMDPHNQDLRIYRKNTIQAILEANPQLLDFQTF